MVDLLVVLFIVCILTSLVFSAGTLVKMNETARRVKCASNLRQFGQGLLLYANENKGAYPRTVYTPDAPLTQYTGVDAKDPFGKDGPKPNDTTSPIFLVIRTQDLPAESLVCPSTDAKPVTFPQGKSAADFSNFKSEENLSYSFANIYPGKKAVETGYKLNTTASAEFAVAADMNPGTFGDSDVTPAKGPKDQTANAAAMQKGNSMNHRGVGQNVLYGDGHVEFNNNPFCGAKRDNIYTVSASNDGSKTTSDKIAASPAGPQDSVLLPVATANPHKKTPDEEELDAAREFKAQLPKIKAAIAQAEQQNGETPQIKQIKQRIAEAEKEVAEIEAKSQKK